MFIWLIQMIYLCKPKSTGNMFGRQTIVWTLDWINIIIDSNSKLIDAVNFEVVHYARLGRRNLQP